jgi:uncharacterized repeat protein (TIGR03803 family)
MRSLGLYRRFSAALTILFPTILLTGVFASAQSETVLHNFLNHGSGGYQPYGGLAIDAAGNLYGTTFTGGSKNGGTVFELSPKAGGGWTGKVLHEFTQDGVGGSSPLAGPIVDTSGNLYGTTAFGGATDQGTVFELTSTAGGWRETVLYSFGKSSIEGALPYSPLIFDAAGNLYGTTAGGGAACSCGAVFELIPTAGGGWKEKTLHRFKDDGVDGDSPVGGLVFDASGNLYGTASGGGDLNCYGDSGYAGCGAVFELTPSSDGTWTETVLHDFGHGGSDGVYPYGGLVVDAAGNLYGTTLEGGEDGRGVVYKLTHQADGTWTENAAYSFGTHSSDGDAPMAGVIFDAAGNLYGTTMIDGIDGEGGTVFELVPKPGGGWSETMLHRFDGRDGARPTAGLIFDKAGNLYGTTSLGGPGGGGTVFEVSH